MFGIPQDWTYEEVVDARDQFKVFQESRAGFLFDQQLRNAIDDFDSFLKAYETHDPRSVAKFNEKRALCQQAQGFQKPCMGFDKALDERIRAKLKGSGHA